MDYSNKYNKLTRTMLRQYVHDHKDENIVFSPSSFIMLMTIAAQATSGDTRKEIVQALTDSDSYEDLIRTTQELQRSALCSGDLVSADTVLINKRISSSIKDNYPDILCQTFGADLIVSDDMMTDINSWVKDRTKGMIQNIADSSSRDMLAILANAVLFSAEWEEQYERYSFYDDMFANADGSTAHTIMLISREQSYMENDFFTGYSKPYKGDYSYMALLPKKEGAYYLERALTSVDFTTLFKGRRTERVDVCASMPEYQYEYEQDSAALCDRLGIRRMFTDAAEFDPLSKEQLRLDSVLLKARVEVDRRGTKAAAVYTESLAGDVSLDSEPTDYLYKTIDLNRPFVYAIVHNETGLPVFAGVVNHLESTVPDEISLDTRQEMEAWLSSH